MQAIGFLNIVQNIAGRNLSTVCVNQTNLNGKLRKKLGGVSRGPRKNLGGHGPLIPPVEPPLLCGVSKGECIYNPA